VRPRLRGKRGGRIANTPAALDRLLRKLGGDGMTLRFCYEAGPCGYGIHRRLSARGQNWSIRRRSKSSLSAPLSAPPVGSAIDAHSIPRKQLNFNPERP
jgi:hypothetical protein